MPERVSRLLPVLLLGVVLVGARHGAVAEPAAAAGSAAPSGPLGAIRTTLDLGSIVEGGESSFSFVLINTGAQTLNLRAKAGCGCTVIRLAPAIAPGGRAM